MAKAKSFWADGPKFYGATTTGERGQIVIPAQARRDLHISPSSKLLVFGNQENGGLMIMTAENVTRFLARASKVLKDIENVSSAGRGPVSAGRRRPKA